MSDLASHRVHWVARGVRQVSEEQGIPLPLDYSLAVARDGLSRADSVGVTRVGRGVVFHTAPEPDSRQLPIVIGYADPTGAWYRDGRRYVGPATDGANRVASGVDL
jgi:hypothetical protein